MRAGVLEDLDLCGGWGGGFGGFGFEVSGKEVVGEIECFGEEGFGVAEEAVGVLGRVAVVLGGDGGGERGVAGEGIDAVGEEADQGGGSRHGVGSSWAGGLRAEMLGGLHLSEEPIERAL